MTPRELLIWRGNARWYEFVLYLCNIDFEENKHLRFWCRLNFNDIPLIKLKDWKFKINDLITKYPKIPSMIDRMMKIRKEIDEIDRGFRIKIIVV